MNSAGSGSGAGGTSATSGGRSGAGGSIAGSPGTGGLGTGGDVSIDPPPSTFPLLVVATESGIQVWQNADELVDGDPADFDVSVSGEVFEVVATRQRLGVISTDGVFLFDDLGTLGASSTPVATILGEVFLEEFDGYFRNSTIDSEGDLWVTYGPGQAALLEGFDSLTSSSTPSAEFVHEWNQLASFSYSAKEDVLFGIQVSGAGVQIYESPKTKSGTVSPDGALDSFSGWDSALLEDSLFVAGNELAFWHGVSSGPSAPTAVFDDGGLSVDAAANSVAVLDVGADSLRYYASASALSSSASPETLEVPQGTKGLDLSVDGQSVAVLGEDVYLVEHGDSGLSLRATLPLVGQGTALTFVE